MVPVAFVFGGVLSFLVFHLADITADKTRHPYQRLNPPKPRVVLATQGTIALIALWVFLMKAI